MNAYVPEVTFAERLRTLLNIYGSARLEYISAEFQPFSNQQRPDIIFVPHSGGYRGHTVFIEIKLSTVNIQTGRGYQNLVEHKDFASEALDSPISRYIYVTNAAIPDFSKKFLLNRHVQVFDSVSTESEVVTRLRAIGVISEEQR